MAEKDSRGFILTMRERKLPKEWGGIVPTKVFFSEAKRIVNEAKKKGLIIRILGGVAIRMHCKEQEELAKRLSRLVGTSYIKGEQEFTDLDFAAYRKQREKLPDFFRDLGYLKRKTTLATAASERHIYFHKDGWFHLDIFFDKLLMNHDVPFIDRLELDYPTITPTDLFLEKVQILQFTEKDLKDTWLLLRAHKVSSKEEETINAEYISEILSRDWGFYHTVVTNIKGIRDLAEESRELREEDRRDIISKLDTISERIEESPKSFSWKMRAKIGTKKQWYRPVETDETVGGFGIWRLKEKKD
ncbi:MAG: hypothetical protein ACE5K0_10150 [Candidatus Methanofastidiosia archaeon]